jgi:hypothetical protein
MKKESFVYYRSFWDAIQTRPDNERLALYDAILLYAFEGKQSELQGVEYSIFTLIKPQIDANHRKWENGFKGGRPNSNKVGLKDVGEGSDEITTGFKNENLMRNEEGERSKEEGLMENEEREIKNDECYNENYNLNHQWKKPSKEFEQFWDLYPKKVGKKEAEELFEQLTPQDQSAAINNISRLYSQTPKQFVPNPSRYLSESRWEDEKVKQTFKPYNSEERDEDLPYFS